MFKFLRKYNTLILAIGGSLLLVVFLLGNAIPAVLQRMGGTSATVATLSNGKDISVTEWDVVQNEVEFLSRIGVSIPSVGQIRDPEHWYLLTMEADQAGMIGGPSSAVLEGFISAQELDQLALNAQLPRQFIYERFAKVSGVRRHVVNYMNTVKLSDARLLDFAERLLPTVQAQIVVLEADAEQGTMPSDAEINAHYQAFRDVEPGEGEMGFGYRLPNRGQLEWLFVDPDVVRIAAQSSEGFSRINQTLHWEKNAGIRGIPEVDETATIVPQVVKDDLLNELTETMLDDISKMIRREVSLSRRGVQTDTDGYLELPPDWSANQLNMTAVAAKIRAEYGVAAMEFTTADGEWLTADEMTAIPGFSARELVELGKIDWIRTPETEAEGLAIVQAFIDSAESFRDGTINVVSIGGLPMSELSSRVAANDANGVIATLEAMGFAGRNDADSDDDETVIAKIESLDNALVFQPSAIGRATTRRFTSTPASLPVMFAAARDFGAENAVYKTQASVIGPVLRAVNGDTGALFAYRLMELDARRAPANVDEVRDAIVRDLRRRSHYERLLANQSGYEATAETDGLIGLALQEGTIIQIPARVAKCDLNRINTARFQGETPKVVPTPLPVVGDNSDAVSTIVDYASALTGDINTLDETQRIFAVPVDDSLALMIVRVDRFQPVDQVQFDTLRQQLILQVLIQGNELDIETRPTPQNPQNIIVDTFTKDAMIARHGFEFTRQNDEEEVDTTEETVDETALSSAG
ncbi:MAG: hypothetical protein AAF432_03650 [Planctomycetota bacterium]